MASFELPKLTHPDFSEKGRKPVGGVEIDKSHWASDLMHAFPLVDQQELVAGVMPTSGTSDLVLPRYIEGDGTQTGVIYGQATDCPTYPFTIATRFKINSRADFNMLFHIGSRSSDAQYAGITLYIPSSTETTYEYVITTGKNSGGTSSASRGTSTHGAPLSIGKVHDLVLVCNSHTDRTIFVDGVIQDSFASSGSYTGEPVAGTEGVIIGAARHGTNTQRYVDGNVYSLFVWDWGMTDTQARAMSLNPYQFLKPQIPLTYFTAAEEAAAAAFHTFELPKLAHPDFSEPNRKPVGGVVIDRDHPLARGLIRYDVDGTTMDSDGSVQTVVGVGGKGLKLNNNGDEFNFSRLNHSDYEGFTLLVIGSFGTGYGSNPGFMRSGNFGNQGEIFLTQNISRRPWIRWDGVDILKPASGAELPTDELCSVAFGVTHNDTVAIHINGKLEYSNTHTSTSTGFFNYYGWQSSTGERFDQTIYALGMWGRELSSVEVASLHRNPYQILKPANPLTYFFAAEEVAAAFKAYWARNSNTIIQQVTR